MSQHDLTSAADIPAAPGTLDPDALAWPGPPSKADLGVHVLPLTYGGELTVTEHAGEYQLRIDVDGGHFGIRLSILDVWGLRSTAGDVVMARVAETQA